MALIISKTISGHTYYYLVESARVGGKPRIVSQCYLGKASDIEAAVDGATVMPDRTRHLAFGDVAAVWEMLWRLRVAEMIDRWLQLPAGALDHRRSWEAMDAIGEEQINETERPMVGAMVETLQVDLSGLVLDMTNFATWIDSNNERARIARRGHFKQKRSDLRIVGLGLVVSTDGAVPLVSHAYPGNKPDVTQFPVMVAQLVGRFEVLFDDGDELYQGERGRPRARRMLTEIDPTQRRL
jgi:hypothetical protein